MITMASCVILTVAAAEARLKMRLINSFLSFMTHDRDINLAFPSLNDLLNLVNPWLHRF